MAEYLYEAFCKYQGLLYVGITNDFQRRIRQHRATKDWWPEVDCVPVSEFTDRFSARRAELATIRHDHPSHNVDGARPFEEASCVSQDRAGWKRFAGLVVPGDL